MLILEMAGCDLRLRLAVGGVELGDQGVPLRRRDADAVGRVQAVGEGAGSASGTSSTTRSGLDHVLNHVHRVPDDHLRDVHEQQIGTGKVRGDVLSPTALDRGPCATGRTPTRSCFPPEAAISGRDGKGPVRYERAPRPCDVIAHWFCRPTFLPLTMPSETRRYKWTWAVFHEHRACLATISLVTGQSCAARYFRMRASISEISIGHALRGCAYGMFQRL